MAERIIPGVYTTVRSEGLISAPAFGVGTIGVVGTANKGEMNEPIFLSSSSDIRTYLGTDGSDLTLVKAVDFMYKNGAGSVIVVRSGDGSEAKSEFVLKEETGTTDTLTLTAKTEGTYGDNIRVTVTTTATPTADNIVVVSDLVSGDSETYTGADADDIANQINDTASGSELVDASVSSGQGAENLQVQANTPLTGGDNGTSAIGNTEYIAGLAVLEEVDAQIIHLAGQTNASLHASVEAHCSAMSDQNAERIGVVGGPLGESVPTIQARMGAIDSDRLIMVARGVKALSLVTGIEATFDASYSAACICGLLSGNDPQVSITNKTLSGVTGLESGLSRTAVEQLITSRVCVIFQKNGFRVAKGITTSTNTTWHQITTRRIVDGVKIGVRGASDPYIGTLNIATNRANLGSSISAFLNNQKNSNALVSYTVSLSASRDDEIAGRIRVDVTMQPVFSIDFIEVTLILE